MAESDQDGSGFRDRLMRALHHGVAAARCCLALLGAEAAAAISRVASRVVWLASCLFAALLAVVFVLWGMAQLLNDWWGRPGLGQLVVGLVVLALVAVALSCCGGRRGAPPQDGAGDA